jgi:adenylate kinase
MKITFIGGIHGVGKTTSCAGIAKILGIRHSAASDLIRQQYAASIIGNSKIVKDAVSNQKLLLAAINVLRDDNAALLLDGHFTLMSEDGVIRDIDAKVFEDLQLSSIVVFYDNENAISDRLKARDNTQTPPALLKDWQSMELACARRISKSLGIPCIELKAFDVAGLESHMRTNP